MPSQTGNARPVCIVGEISDAAQDLTRHGGKRARTTEEDDRGDDASSETNAGFDDGVGEADVRLRCTGAS